MTSAAIINQPTHTADLDDEIYALNLQLEEMDMQSTNSKRKWREGSAPDNELAAATLEMEIRSHLQFLNDLVFAHSLACAVDTDANVISAIVQDELQTEHDRQFALSINEQDPGFADTLLAKEDMDANVEDEQAQIAILAAYEQRQSQLAQLLYAEDDNQEVEAGPSIPYAERQKQALKKMNEYEFECVSCADRFLSHRTTKAPCGHVYCYECLKVLFSKAVKDESLYPPRCCRQEISLNLATPAMSSKEMEIFQRAQIEFGTTNRTYCSNTACSEFIVPTHIDGNGCASCEYCHTKTCVHCKREFHEDECLEDPDFQATIAMADELGWKRCYKCNMFVELNLGCNHMTCKCGGQFCYQCSAIWKTCNCEHWTEANLMNRAEEVVDREAARWLPPVERQHRVQLMRAELLEQHECDHPGKFERIFHGGRRGFRCEMCEDRHWKYILRCRHCHIQVCEECRRHRIR